MLPYLILLALIILWIALEHKALNRRAFWIPWLMLSLFAGMRSFRVGTDSGNYTKEFRSGLDIYNFRFSETIELGYQLLEYSLLSITKNYFWLFFITALIVTFCYLKTIKKYSTNYWFSVFLYITLGYYTFFFNGLRQGLAMAIFTIALPFLLNKKFIPYVLICFIGSLFHTSALFMIPFYFIVNLEVRPIYKIAATFLGSLLTSRLLVSYVAESNERYEGYTQVSDSAGGYLILSFQVALVLLIYIVTYVYKIKDQKFLKLFTFYASGVVFIIPVAMLGANPSGPQRLLAYFTWTLILILPTILKKIDNIYITTLGVILFIIYFILTTSKFSNLVPYVINPIFEIF